MKTPLIVLDAADIDAVGRCWAALLDGDAERDPRYDDWLTVKVGGRAVVAVQLAPDHQPPDWPDGNPQQVHFDFYPEDLEMARQTARAGGARLLQPSTQEGENSGFEVWADPAGHPFCLCWEA